MAYSFLNDNDSGFSREKKFGLTPVPNLWVGDFERYNGVPHYIFRPSYFIAMIRLVKRKS
jgi:hypothetical protein